MSNHIKYFKIYGQQRTGTNYISTLLLNNFLDTNIFMNLGGWKHGNLIEYPDCIELVNTVDTTTKNNIEIDKIIDLFKNNNVNFLVIIKNPYMWINSMSIYKKQQITSSFVIEYITIWNDIYSNYKYYIENEIAYLVKYEELLEQPIETLDKIKKKFNLIQKNTEYIIENNILLANDDYNIGKIKNRIFNKNKYIKPNIYKYLSNDIIQFINENIDISLLKYYNYDLVII
jgi:hypothetical protein